jgi:hypothetical protein
VKLMPAEELDEEATFLECQRHLGPHSVLRNASLQLFWFKQFPKQDEVSLESFWSNFAKNLDRSMLFRWHETFTSQYCRNMPVQIRKKSRSHSRPSIPLDCRCA